MSEHDEQVALFEWSEWLTSQHPRLKWMFAIPNGGKRHLGTAVKMKREGVKKGVPDIFVPIPTKTHHGLFIEMKFGYNKPSFNQKEWLEYLGSVGYKAVVCYGFEEAMHAIGDYLA